MAQDRPDSVEKFLYKLVTRYCMPKQYELKMRQAIKKMSRMNIIHSANGNSNIAEELDRIYRFHCILENSQLCSQYWSELYPNNSQAVNNIMARGICTDDYVAHLLEQFPQSKFESMASTSQNFSIAEKFAYILRETQTRMDLLISMNKDSPESVGKQSQAKSMQVTTDTSDTFDTSNPTTSTEIQALLQAQTNQFTSQINKLTNQFQP